MVCCGLLEGACRVHSRFIAHTIVSDTQCWSVLCSITYQYMPLSSMISMIRIQHDTKKTIVFLTSPVSFCTIKDQCCCMAIWFREKMECTICFGSLSRCFAAGCRGFTGFPSWPTQLPGARPPKPREDLMSQIKATVTLVRYSGPPGLEGCSQSPQMLAMLCNTFERHRAHTHIYI